ncbi:ORC6 [Auxenochlorella protothecoides x Auxenochlorella symbiontica]
MLARRVGISDRAVQSKASEYMRLANTRLAGASMGTGEACKAAACLELSCMMLQHSIDSGALQKHSGASATVYRNARAMLQKLLGVKMQTHPRDLCLQFGCVRLERPVAAALATFKQRYVAQVAIAQRGTVALNKPVFVAAIFLAVAQKNKVKVDKRRLLEPLGVLPTEFAAAATAVASLMPELSTGSSAKRRRKPEGAEDEAADGCLAVAASARLEELGSSDEEVLEDGAVGRRVHAGKQQKREYDAWKTAMLEQRAAEAKAHDPPSGPLRQATLTYAAPAREKGSSCM